MTATLNIPFAIGQELWWCGNGYKEEWITCPECAGDKALTIIQGNGVHVSVDCAACSAGYEPPRGSVKRIYYVHTPEKFIANRVDISGNEFRYSKSLPDAGCYSTANASDLFATEAECAAHCDRLNAERTEAEAENLLTSVASRRKNVAWSVHYWQRQVTGLERDLERARARLARCKERKMQASK